MEANKFRQECTRVIKLLSGKQKLTPLDYQRIGRICKYNTQHDIAKVLLYLMETKEERTTISRFQELLKKQKTNQIITTPIADIAKATEDNKIKTQQLLEKLNFG